jgi:hypothetical protein
LKEVASMKGFMLAGLALLLVGLGVGKSVAQAPNDWWEWVKTFGGSGNDEGYSVQQTSDGGFILVGTTEVLRRQGGLMCGSSRPMLRGDIELWDRRPSAGSRDDRGHSVQQTSDGGFIVLGDTESFGAGEGDVWLIKTDAEWEQALGSDLRRELPQIGAYSVQQTSDGGFIIVGNTGSFGAGWGDVWLIKTDADGNKLWDRTFGGSGSDFGRSVQQTSDGGFIIVGYTESFSAGGPDVWLIKTDANGNKLWDRTFGGSENDLRATRCSRRAMAASSWWEPQRPSAPGWLMCG